MFQKKKRQVSREYLDFTKDLSCVACGVRPCDPDHISTRGAGGGDQAFNVWPLCRACHITRHSKGICRFALGNPCVMLALNERGWKVVKEFDKWKLIRSE